MFQKLLNGIVGQRTQQRQADLYRNLIRHEARIGGQVFGPIPAGHHREFFCLDSHSWVWHEEWQDQYGKTHVRTTRYDVRPDGLLKSQHGNYQRVSEQETKRFKQAVKLYLDRINQEMYSGLIA
ncbi:MAG TPA: hypothetical protein VLE74_03535 [Candidatus Saccharimonadales bacterium]|nr:hypothetical protein [Candidatus Saccharimonadales bacterium]